MQAYVFEDLNSRNYYMQDRHVGFDLQQSKILYKKLAKFYAASVIYHQKHGDYNSQIFFPIYNEKQGVFIKQMIDSMIPYFLEVIENSQKLRHLIEINLFYLFIQISCMVLLKKIIFSI